LIGVCILSRLAEVLGGGILLYSIIFNFNINSIIGDIGASIVLCILFEFISGYVGSSSFILLYKYHIKNWRYVSVIVILFLIHACAFMVVFSWPFGFRNTSLLLLGGGVLVALIALASQKFLAR
jgi:hypothetical protein